MVENVRFERPLFFFDGTADRRQVFAYDGNQIVFDFQRDGSSDLQIGHLEQRYLWGPAVDRILAEEEVDGGTDDMVQWTLTDHLNTVRDIAKYDPGTDTTTVVNHLVYNAFGNVTSETDPTVDSLFLYTGRPFDEDTGLQNNLNRWYDPAVGRWLSEDPVGFEAGDDNLYRYVRGRPLTNADPKGLGIRISADCILVSERVSGVWRFCDYNCLEDTSVERISIPKGGTDDVEKVPKPLAFRYSTTTLRLCSCAVTKRLDDHLYSSYTPPLKDCSRSECLRACLKTLI